MIDPRLLTDLVLIENRYIAMRDQTFLCSATFVSILRLYRKEKAKRQLSLQYLDNIQF